jgi:hypothetical protein
MWRNLNNCTREKLHQIKFAFPEGIKSILNSENACCHFGPVYFVVQFAVQKEKSMIYWTIILPVVSCGWDSWCVSWCVTLREEHGLRVRESRCWGGYLYLPGLRKMGNEGGCIVRSLMVCANYKTFFEWLIREWGDGLDMWHVWGIGEIHTGQWWGKRFHWKPRGRMEDNIKMEIQETKWGGVDGMFWLRGGLLWTP